MTRTATGERDWPDEWKPTIRSPEDIGVVVAKCPCTDIAPEASLLLVGRYLVFVGVRYKYEKKPFYILVTPDLMDSQLERIIAAATKVVSYFKSKESTLKRFEWMMLMGRNNHELYPKLQSMIDEFNAITSKNDIAASHDMACINAVWQDYIALSTKFR